MAEAMSLEGGQPMLGQGSRKKRTSKKRYVLTGVLLFLLLVSSISTMVGYLVYQAYSARYHADISLAQTGMQHLQRAEALLAAWAHRPLNVQLTDQAEAESTSAYKSFTLLNSDLRSLPEFIRQVPMYGARLNSALRLVPLATTLAQAGVAGCRILSTLVTGLRDPLTSQGNGISLSDLAAVDQNVKGLASMLVLATRQVEQLQPADMQFDSRLPNLIGTFNKDVPVIQASFDALEQLLPVAPVLLGVGRPANYLIEVLDSTELRPAGGFIGNYGIATLSGGRLTAAHITDTDLLDKPFEFAGNTIPYPTAYTWFGLSPRSWSFRDSNLDADFPTAARYGEETYVQEGGKVPVQGVIAITPALIQHALAITGPINMLPEYNETVTAQNLIERIHFHQLGPGAGSELIPSPDGHSTLRKRFTELLGEHFLASVQRLPSAGLSQLLLLVASSVRSKDLQIYFNSRIAENMLHRFHLDAAIESPASDSLFVVDANEAANKANGFIISTLDDQVTIDDEGNVIHHATLNYAWTIAGQNYGNSVYRDYVRVYLPPGSILLMQNGWEPRGTSSAFNRKVWMGFFTLSYRQTRTITLVWEVPAAASKDRSGWHYQYLIQRQAGVLWKLNLHMVLPLCGVLTNRWGGLESSDKQQAKLTQTITQDLNIGTDYVCK